MKLTKLLALLMALCMVLCCFAACGGDDKKDDDKKEKTEETTDEKKETETETEAADSELEGVWKTNVDISEAYMSLMGGIEETELEIPSLVFGVEWEFAEDGEFTVTAVELPSEEDVYSFCEVSIGSTMGAFLEMFSDDELVEYLADMGYESLDAYMEDIVKDTADEMIMGMKEEPVMSEGEYEVDGNVISINGGDAEITFKIEANEMTFEDVEDEYEEYTMYMGAVLVKE